MVNRVILIGNLGKDPEFKMLDNGSALARISIATNESYKDKSGEWQDLTEWHDIVTWRNLAERAQATLKKGMTIYLEGKLSTRSWQDQDGNTRRTTEVVANYFRVIDRKPAAENTQPPIQKTNTSNIPEDFDGSDSTGGMDSNVSGTPTADDDLPF